MRRGDMVPTSATPESAVRASHVVVLGVPSKAYQLPVEWVKVRTGLECHVTSWYVMSWYVMACHAAQGLPSPLPVEQRGVFSGRVRQSESSPRAVGVRFDVLRVVSCRAAEWPSGRVAELPSGRAAE